MRTPAAKMVALRVHGHDDFAADYYREAVARMLAGTALALVVGNRLVLEGEDFRHNLTRWAYRAASLELDEPSFVLSTSAGFISNNPSALIQQCFRFLSSPRHRGWQLGPARDLTLLLLPEKISVVYQENDSRRFPVLFVKGQEGKVGYLFLHKVDEGFGECYEAPEKAMAKLQGNLRRAMEAAWKHVKGRHARPSPKNEMYAGRWKFPPRRNWKEILCRQPQG